MVLAKKINPVARAVMTITAVAALVSGVTFAATSQATLTGNNITMAAATADLQLWNGIEFASTAPGFSFSDLEPGEESDPFNFYFKNNGNVPLDVTASIPTLPDLTALSFGADDVTLTFYGAESCAEAPLVRTMTELNDVTLDELPCNPLEEDAQGVVGEDATNEANYRVTAKIAETVELGDTTEVVPSFDIVFTGDTELVTEL